MSFILRIALPLGIAMLLAPLTARAQSEAPAASPPAVASSTPERNSGMRLRFGAGGEGGALFKPDGNIAAAGFAGAYLRLGLQFNDLVGVHVTGAASTYLGLTSYARGALIVDFSPADFFSAGTGFAVAGTTVMDIHGHGPNSWTFIGVPLVLSLYTPGRSLPTGARRGASFAFTGTLGYARDNHAEQTGDGAPARGLGGSVMVSIGYEIH